MELERFSIGIGDRFGFECAAQLRALQQASGSGIRIVPVWNKSNREHLIAGTVPEDARRAADEAVRACGWNDSYYVDADHIGPSTVDGFLPSHDFFTIDVADYIGKRAHSGEEEVFLTAMARFKGSLGISGMPEPIRVTDAVLKDFAQKYLFAISKAGSIYRHITDKKGAEHFVTEISMDEAQNPQTPVELMLILAAVSLEEIPLQTIAPKFTGSFLKGVDYVGDPERFTRQFHDDLAVIEFAVNHFDLPRNLKLSIHTGSDKFSLYPIMHGAVKDMDTGIHLKTAGTTWLEELAALAVSGGGGLAFAREIYQMSYERCEELCSPYLAVIRIDRLQLPPPERVASWVPEEFAHALRHDPLCRDYNPHLRQLLHLGFKIAAEQGPRFAALLRENRAAVEYNVTKNLYERHIRPLFLGLEPD
jgi:hypothetical protein